MEFFHSSSRKVTKTVSIIILGTLSAKTFFQYGFSGFFCLCLSLCDVYVHAYVCEHMNVCGEEECIFLCLPLFWCSY